MSESRLHRDSAVHTSELMLASDGWMQRLRGATVIPTLLEPHKHLGGTFSTSYFLLLTLLLTRPYTMPRGRSSSWAAAWDCPDGAPTCSAPGEMASSYDSSSL